MGDSIARYIIKSMIFRYAIRIEETNLGSASKLLVIAASAQNNSRVISWHDHTVRSTNSCLPNVRPRSGVAPLVTIQFQRGQSVQADFDDLSFCLRVF